MPHYDARPRNDICLTCGGKGFHYTTGSLINKADGSEIATLYKEGKRCDMCGGSGIQPPLLSCSILIAVIVIAFVFLVILAGYSSIFPN